MRTYKGLLYIYYTYISSSYAFIHLYGISFMLIDFKSGFYQADDCLFDADLKFDNFSSDLAIKQEPQSLTDAEMHALVKDRQKKDNHNMSK